MKTSVVVSSRTGNTALLAEQVRHVLEEETGAKNCLYYGAPNIRALEAERIFVGFWTDKGSCDEAVADFLGKLSGKKVFLFGTAGFGGSNGYFQKILAHVCDRIPEDNQIIGTYMCQGRMAASVRERYEKLAESQPDDVHIRAMLANYDQALGHPDETDLCRLTEAVEKALKEA